MASARPPPTDINFDIGFLELPLAPNFLAHTIRRLRFTARWSARGALVVSDFGIWGLGASDMEQCSALLEVFSF